MQVRIGVQSVPKEIVVDTAESADDVQRSLADALAKENGVFSVRDRNGALVLVPARNVGYLEITENEQRAVGFGN